MGGQGTRTRDPVPDDVLADSADLGAVPVSPGHPGLAWRGQPVFMIRPRLGRRTCPSRTRGTFRVACALRFAPIRSTGFRKP
jgi:hypothetical protein